MNNKFIKLFKFLCVGIILAGAGLAFMKVQEANVKPADSFATGLKALKENNIDSAKKHFNIACLKNNAPSCFNLGVLWEKENNSEKATEYYNLACQNKHYTGCHNLASYLYKAGKKAEAQVYYRLSCENNKAVNIRNDSCLNFGDAAEKDKNSDEAIWAFSKLCNEKVGPGCNREGIVWMELKKDVNKALERWKVGCSLRNNEACGNEGTYTINKKLNSM